MVNTKNIVKNFKPKLIVILGPTSGGKTGLGVKLAQEFNGEIVSADSRQVYIGMDIGTGKDLAEYILADGTVLPYHLIDVAKPTEEFDLAQYKQLADEAIKKVSQRGKLPFLVGGSGLYLQAVVDDYQLSLVSINQEYRKELEGLSTEELFSKLKKLNPAFAEKLNPSDQKNKRRLIRYLEIQEQSKFSPNINPSKYDVLLLGLNPGKEVLEKRIHDRLIQRLEKENLVEEVQGLHQEGVSWQRLENFGLEYKFVSRYLQGQLEYQDMVEKLFIAIRQFAKRQLTWFRRWERQGKKIHWLENKEEAEALIKNFLK